MPADKLSTEMSARKPDLFDLYANWLEIEEIDALLANMYCSEVTPTHRFYTASLSMDDEEEIHSNWTEELHGEVWYLVERNDQEPTETYKAECLAEKEAGYPYLYDNRQDEEGWEPRMVRVVWDPEPNAVGRREGLGEYYGPDVDCASSGPPKAAEACVPVIGAARFSDGGKKRVRSAAFD